MKRQWRVMLLFTAAGLCFGLAPLALTPSYDWIEHTTSESAAQGVDGAWVARLAFLAYGAAVASDWLPRPRSWARASHVSFAATLAGVAAFSSRDWMGGPYDTMEDLLHSIMATAMGFLFAGGVALEALQRGKVRIRDVVAVAASVVLPIGMTVWPGAAGLLQRAMFLVAALWYIREAWSVRPQPRPDQGSTVS